VAWTRDGRTLLLATDRGVWRADAPPAAADLRPVPAAERAAADSALEVWLGDPPFARAAACPAGRGICVLGDSGASPLDAEGDSPLRWGPDSVGYFVKGNLVVRPLGPGRMRELRWRSAPGHPREATVFVPATGPR
jgi:hypothetical protein